MPATSPHRQSWARIGVGLLALVISLPVLSEPALKTTPLDVGLTSSESSFIARHWSGDTILPQGPPPQHYSLLEASLSASDCGVCHPRQYADWQTTRHRRAMGPGITGQTLDMRESDPETARMCWRCHTPLAEQQPLLQQPADGTWQENPLFDADLQHQGLTCAACHVRQHQRFGPPSRRPKKAAAHGGFSEQTAYTRSAFCQHCHQFPADAYALNGKLMENTYNEWLASDYARDGVQCQDCHMPDRRHLWRGIHDPEMVKKAVTISVTRPQFSPSPAAAPNEPLHIGDTLTASIRIINSGAGHYFPTYVTPKVFVRAQLLDASGEVVVGSVREAIIGRETSADLSREIYDSRIAPGDFVDIGYAYPVSRIGQRLQVQVRVEPDHFYERFYRGLLQSGSPQKGRAAIEQALVDAQQSAFVIFDQTLSLEILP